MAKPIFVVTICRFVPEPKSRDEIIKSFDPLREDYHVLVNFNANATESKFQLFSDKEIEPIRIEELKKLLHLQEHE